MTRKTITQPPAEEAKSPLTDDELAEIRKRDAVADHLATIMGMPLPAAQDRRRLLAEVERLRSRQAREQRHWCEDCQDEVWHQ